MWNNGHDAYLESRVLSADPVELVNLLYQACIQAVRDARYRLEQGAIAERSQAVNKACAILIELTAALDSARGGEIASRLGQLYDYMQRRLLEAHMHQTDAPLAEVLGLLMTLAEAWEGVRPTAPAPAPAENIWSRDAAQEVSTAHAWSF
ncbi:MAG: flagellar export chaperone FliS [Acidobacteria bacterium]|nr:flagellar export chaperone FliS [Acidobacteriota bacterium]